VTRCGSYRTIGGHFATDEAVFKLLYLAMTNLDKTWERSIQHWNNVLGQFSIFFKDRIFA